LTHVIEAISLQEINFGVDMMWTEWLSYRIVCAVDVFHLVDKVALDMCVCVCVCACVAALIRWGCSTR